MAFGVSSSNAALKGKTKLPTGRRSTGPNRVTFPELTIGPLHWSVLRRKSQLFAAETSADQCQKTFPGGLDRNTRVSEARKRLYAPLTAQLLKHPWSPTRCGWQSIVPH